MTKEFLRVDEVADILRITPHTLRRWIKKGKVRGLRCGPRILIEPSELERFLRPTTSVDQESKCTLSGVVEKVALVDARKEVRMSEAR
jgi:excisionase family DNA binding protein